MDCSDGYGGHLWAVPHLEVVDVPLCPHDHLAGRDGLATSAARPAVTKEPEDGRDRITRQIREDGWMDVSTLMQFQHRSIIGASGSHSFPILN